MKRTLLLLFFLFIAGCNPEPAPPIDQAVEDNVPANFELYAYPEWLDDCDRFRPIFERELERYPLLRASVDLSWIYSLVYQESLCMTQDELRIKYREKNLGAGWQGGIMQVDGCWRWGAPYDCSTIQDQIKHGIRQLNFSYSRVDADVRKANLSQFLSREQRLALLFFAYNRGHYTSSEAASIYRTIHENDTFLIDGLTKEENGDLFVLVECVEPDVCRNDGEYLNITDEIKKEKGDFERALLIACRHRFGFMADVFADYCTGNGYGVRYYDWINGIHSEILKYQQNKTHVVSKQKEFYSGELSFSNYSWYVKDSIGKTGPGPNFFFLNDSSVYLDNSSNLHMQILSNGSDFYSSEVVLKEKLGYGKYTFYIKGDLTGIDNSTVLGLFTYDLNYLDVPGYYHREMDVEISRWSNEIDANAFTVQGELPLQAVETFMINTTNDVIFSFDWQPSVINFEYRLDDHRQTLLKSWNYTGPLIPLPGDEHARINLWMYEGKPFGKPREEVVIKKFEFVKN